MPIMTKDLKSLTPNEIDLEVFGLLKNYDVEPLVARMPLVSLAHRELEIKNRRGDNLYYQWLACLTKLLKPKQVVELGAAAGMSTMMIASELSPDAILYSCDNDPAIAWKWMSGEWPQVKRLLGSDLDLKVWKGVDLEKTDLWFIDTLHFAEQLKKEIELYSPYWKKGAIVVFDDIRMNDMYPVWESLSYDKQENTNPCHYSGFGFIRT